LKAKVLYESRAVVLYEEENSAKRYLVVGDLHIGFEERFQSSGVQLQSNSERMLSDLINLIHDNRITDLIINGDVKSGTDRILKSEWENVPKFFSTLARECGILVVPGNHDGGLTYLLPSTVELLDINGLLLSGNLILHGHTRPLTKYMAECRRVIMGHVHPIFQRRGNPLSGQPVWVMLKVPKNSVFKEALPESGSSSIVEVILMPSFNLDLVVAGYSAEAAREERRIAPLVRELKAAKDAVITTLHGEVIGNLSLLEDIL
jgi:putative SbcD/Mre11-related phosphoesterase